MARNDDQYWVNMALILINHVGLTLAGPNNDHDWG